MTKRLDTMLVGKNIKGELKVVNYEACVNMGCEKINATWTVPEECNKCIASDHHSVIGEIEIQI